MFFSCTEPHPPSVSTYYNIINNTNYKINLIYYNRDLIDSSQVLLQLDSVTFMNKVDGNTVEPPPFLADSVAVIYDDSIKIIHYRIQNQGINKNIFYEESWIKENINEFVFNDVDYYEYKYDYNFTEEDYLEAKEK